MPFDVYSIIRIFIGVIMRTVSTAKAKSEFTKLVRETGVSHEPIQINGKKSNAVLLSFEDWKAIQETLYLLSIPKMRESIRKGLKMPLGKCQPELPWWNGRSFLQKTRNRFQETSFSRIKNKNRKVVGDNPKQPVSKSSPIWETCWWSCRSIFSAYQYLSSARLSNIRRQ